MLINCKRYLYNTNAFPVMDMSCFFLNHREKQLTRYSVLKWIWQIFLNLHLMQLNMELTIHVHKPSFSYILSQMGATRSYQLKPKLETFWQISIFIFTYILRIYNHHCILHTNGINIQIENSNLKKEQSSNNGTLDHASCLFLFPVKTT